MDKEGVWKSRKEVIAERKTVKKNTRDQSRDKREGISRQRGNQMYNSREKERIYKKKKVRFALSFSPSSQMKDPEERRIQTSGDEQQTTVWSFQP